MNTKTDRKLAFAAALLLGCVLPAAAGGPGSAGMQALKSDMSPRAAGMGGAFTAGADDIYTAEYNPAGLGRLYVPEASVAAIAPGTVLTVNCDGCPAGLTATVTWVATEPEFTPPVIYSLENRQKLVYMIEARPAGPTALKPGQIVDALLPAAAP